MIAFATNPPFVLGYGRVSTPGQVSRPGELRDGLPRQCERAQQFCDDQGWELQAFCYEPGLKGSTAVEDRAGAAEAIELFAQQQGRKILVLERSDRMARDLLVNELMLQKFLSQGIEVWSADGGFQLANDPENPTGTAIRQILAVMAQLDKNMTVARLRSGRLRKKLLTNGVEGKEGPKAYGVKPGEMAVLELILTSHAAGDKPTRIARRLNEQNILTRSKRPWSRTNVANLIAKTKVGV